MKNWPKYATAFLLCLTIRLVPFRPPNVEPIMATILPFGKKFGYAGGFSFGFLGILAFDALTSGIGMWTWVTAIAYGLAGAGAAWFFARRKSSIRNYVSYSIIATIAYDLTTGLSVGPLFFGQPLAAAITGQIPFTLAHLAGNILFAALLSPAIYRWVADNRNLDAAALMEKIKNIAVGARLP